MSQNVGPKLCATKGCHFPLSDNGNHNCCPSHSSCYDSVLAVYQPSNCEQCLQWISQLQKVPHDTLKNASREKLISWISKLQKLRRERHLPGNVVKDVALQNFIFSSEYSLNERNGLHLKQALSKGSPRQNRHVRSRIIVSDDSEEDEEPPEKRSRNRESPQNDQTFPVRKSRSRESSQSDHGYPGRRSRESSQSDHGYPGRRNRESSQSDHGYPRRSKSRESSQSDHGYPRSSRESSQSHHGCLGRSRESSQSDHEYPGRSSSSLESSQSAHEYPGSGSRGRESSQSDHDYPKRRSKGRESSQSDREYPRSRGRESSQSNHDYPGRSRSRDSSHSDHKYAGKNRNEELSQSNNEYPGNRSRSRESSQSDHEYCGRKSRSRESSQCDHGYHRGRSRHKVLSQSIHEYPGKRSRNRESSSTDHDYPGGTSRRRELSQSDHECLGKRSRSRQSLQRDEISSEKKSRCQQPSEKDQEKRSRTRLSSQGDDRYPKKKGGTRHSSQGNDEFLENGCRSRESSVSENEFIDPNNALLAEGNLSSRVELPSMEDVAKTMNWLVHSVGKIQNMLLRKQVKCELIPPTECPDSRNIKAEVKSERFNKRFCRDSVEKCKKNSCTSHNRVQEECSKALESEALKDACQFTGKSNEKLANVWVPLPDEFELDMSTSIPRVKVPVGNKWITISSDKCKVKFCSTVPFIKYVGNGASGDDSGETVSLSKSTPDADRLANHQIDSGTGTVHQISDTESEVHSNSSHPLKSNDNSTVLPINDSDCVAECCNENFDSVWTSYIEGKSSSGFVSFSLVKLICSKSHATELHTALSAPQIGVEDTARLLKIRLRKQPLASYKEEKSVRAQLLRLANSIQSFESLMSSVKVAILDWNESETSVIMDFFQGLEAPMLTLESAFRYALFEFFRVRKTLREKLFRGLRLNLEISELISSSPFSEDLFHPLAVKEFLSQLKQQNLLPSEIVKRKKRSPKKIIFSKKNFALPKRKVSRSGKGDQKSKNHKSHSRHLNHSSRTDKMKKEKVKLSSDKSMEKAKEKAKHVLQVHCDVSHHEFSSED